MKNIKYLTVLAVVALFCTSCSHRILDFTVISTKNVDLSQGASFKKGSNRVKGEDMVHYVITIPLGSVSIKEAVDQAIETTPGCVALLDGVIYSKGWWAILYGREYVVVEGTPLIDPGMASNERAMKYGKIEFDKKGAVKLMEAMDEMEYKKEKHRIEKASKKEKFSKMGLSDFPGVGGSN
ncbi:hypothetical protein [Flagellimonas myxillae]|uniref:hypothetical protein n=1 Tax=Flagellimonas myxillae TaxID=2942214 RepID=UPI00201EC6A7|nr:hypothetical protein [Muricauda myxillae]MCL6267442.1 hypothetical protein [Muricauda myxillae]